MPNGLEDVSGSSETSSTTEDYLQEQTYILSIASKSEEKSNYGSKRESQGEIDGRSDNEGQSEGESEIRSEDEGDDEGQSKGESEGRREDEGNDDGESEGESGSRSEDEDEEDDESQSEGETEDGYIGNNPQTRQNRCSMSADRSASNVLWSKSGRRWTTSEPPKRKIPRANILRQPCGLGRPGTSIQTMKDAFQLLITNEMIVLIVRETNRHATKAVEEWNEQNPDEKWTWKDTDCDEIWALIGLLVLGGVHRSRNEDFNGLWSTNNGRPIYRATMSKNRMDALLKFCRFADVSTRDTRMKTDKLAPISEFWEMFLTRLEVCYVPGGSLTVDEQLIPIRGRCQFRHDMPKRPGKYGIKVFWCCDSNTAYPLKGEVYVGRQSDAAVNTNKSTTKELVKRMVAPWTNKGRSVTTDNYFTSVELAEDLLRVQTTLIGIIRHNKPEIPQQLQANRQRPENSSMFCFDREFTLVSYVPKKNKAVILLSSMHHEILVSEETHKKPDIILYYNETKGGVDRMGQMIQTYSCKRKIKRWPMTFFFNIIDVACVAAYVVWMTKNPQWNNGKSHRRRLFLEQLGRSLVDPQLSRRSQNLHSLQRNVQLAMESLGLPSTHPVAINSAVQGKQRCHLCPRICDREAVARCSICQLSCCPRHHKLICDSCLDPFHEIKRKK